jgi:hypothetical protein
MVVSRGESSCFLKRLIQIGVNSLLPTPRHYYIGVSLIPSHGAESGGTENQACRSFCVTGHLTCKDT